MICIVSHDAGGAEILASYVAQQGLECRFVLAGPALKVFQRRLGTAKLSTLNQTIAGCDRLLCGTSWQSDLEWRAIGLARKAGIRVVAFLDHWVNYRERFIRNGVEHLPDEIWVGDEDAETLTREHFSNTPVQLVPNPYFIDIKRDLAAFEARKPASKGAGKRVLFVCENISEHALLQHGDERYLGYTEFDAIEYFFKNINGLGVAIETVVIRPHPSDSPGKNDCFVAEHSDIAQLSAGKPLLEEIVDSDLVVGCESMAMVVGLLAGRRVISCIPPGGKACALPQDQIEVFQNLLINL